MIILGENKENENFWKVMSPHLQGHVPVPTLDTA